MAYKLIPACIGILTVWSATGQTTSLSGAIIGTVFDAPSRSIRPIVGFPGSSYLGQPLLKNIERAFIAPDGDTTLVIERGRPLLVRGLRAGDLITVPISGLIGQVDQADWSVDSGSLVAYCSSTHSIQWLHLIASSLQVGAPVDLSYLEGDVTGIATNAGASQTVISVRHATRGGLYAVSETAPASILIASGDPGLAVFSTSFSVLYAINRETRQILRFAQGVNGGYEPLTFSGEPEPLSDVVGIALSRDERRLYVAGGADRSIREYDLGTYELVRDIRPDMAPGALSPLSPTGSVFALRARTGDEQPMLVFDVRSTPSVFFVPAVPMSDTSPKRDK